MPTPTDAELKALSTEEFNDLHVRVGKESIRRAILASAATDVAQINSKFLGAQGVVNGAAWRQPTGAHDAYPKGWKVTDSAKTWESLIDGNVWKPGISGWREVVTSGTVAAWVQPTGAHDAYAKGATVTHNGSTWTSDADANVWAPGVYGWTKKP